MIFVNFKTYQEGTGERAVALTRILEEVKKETGVPILPAVQATDILRVKMNTSLEVWGQGIDPVSSGPFTASILAEAVFEAGAAGTFLNHSEAKFQDFSLLEKGVNRAKEAGLKTLVFAADIKELEKVIIFRPDWVAFEPPELIGNQETSVAEKKPDSIRESVRVADRLGIPLLVGAGIHSKEDVKKALELGAKGVVVATAVVRAFDPKVKLLELTDGFK